MQYSLDKVREIIKKYINIKTIKPIGSGNHSEAFCINDSIVVKLPKHKKASDCLKVEMQVLNGLQGRLDLDIPNVLFAGEFIEGNENLVFSASKKVEGNKLDRQQFLELPKTKLQTNANIIAKFLFDLHNQKDILPINRKDLCLLHGDFSLNHVRFDNNNAVCGVLDFGDARIGKYKSDFIYLLDAEDDEEFGIEFGNEVLKQYQKLVREN